MDCINKTALRLVGYDITCGELGFVCPYHTFEFERFLVHFKSSIV